MFPAGMTMTLATLTVSKDNAAVQGQQVRLSAYQVRDNVPVIGLHGVVSRPLPGAQAVVLYNGQDPSNAVIIGHNDPRYYIEGLPDGTVGNAHHQGAHVLIFADRIEIDGGGRNVVVQNADEVQVTATGSVQITAPTVRIDGALQVTGEVTAMCDGASVTLSKHHGHTSSGTPPTPGT